MTETVAQEVTGAQIDPELLEEAQRQLGDVSPDAAINEALHRLVQQERLKRREALETLRRMSDEGLFDYSVLDKEDE
jgi:hypothetical protein